MDRKTFFKKSIQMGLASGSMVLFNGKASHSQTQNAQVDHEQKFKEDWVTALMENLEEQFDEGTRIKLMETCGRGCAKRGAIQIAESCKGDVEKMMRTLSGIPDLEIERNDNQSIRVTYKKCFCELVGKGPDRLPNTYCECSRGWLLQIFETAAEKSVDVEIVQTIKRGGSCCEFIVRT